MEKWQRSRKVRSVTIDESLVARIKEVGGRLVPPTTNLSQLLDMAMEEFIESKGHPKSKRK